MGQQTVFIALVDVNDHFADVSEMVDIVFDTVCLHLNGNVDFENSIFSEGLLSLRPSSRPRRYNFNISRHSLLFYLFVTYHL